MAHAVEHVLRRLGIQGELRGRRYWARCPRALDTQYHAHGDRDPSWMIWGNGMPQKAGLHICRSCKFKGNLKQLVIYVRKLQDDDESTAWEKATNWLAGDVVDEQPVTSVKVNVRSMLDSSFVLPPDVCIGEPLDAWPTPFRRYLAERRVTAAQVARWSIGYALGGRLAGRVVVPTLDRAGRPAGYAARTIGNGKRYLAPDECEHADKNVVFGEQTWQTDRIALAALSGSNLPESSVVARMARIAEEGCVVITEGAFNVLAVERALEGVRPRRGCAIVASDPDAAGDRIAAKLRAAFGRAADVRRVTFPIGADADALPPDQLAALLRGILQVEGQTS